jgi:hypothetical protein
MHMNALQRARVAGHWLRTAQVEMSPQQTEEIVNAVLRGTLSLLAAGDDGQLQPLVPPDMPEQSLPPAAQQHLREEWQRLSAAERAERTAERQAFLRRMREKYASAPHS